MQFDDEGNYHLEKLKTFTGLMTSESSVTAEEIHQAVEDCIKFSKHMQPENIFVKN